MFKVRRYRRASDTYYSLKPQYSNRKSPLAIEMLTVKNKTTAGDSWPRPTDMTCLSSCVLLYDVGVHESISYDVGDETALNKMDFAAYCAGNKPALYS